MLEKKLKDAACATPDPERSLKNLTSFLEEHPSRKDEFNALIREISLLFSVSQFLANYSIAHPDMLFEVLGSLNSNGEKLPVFIIKGKIRSRQW
jgi:glutamine synthetase adenylyltransferase